MVVVSIVAVLAAVAIPAYINHVNRARQSEAFTALMTAKMEQEIYWEDNNFVSYAGTIGCLPSFSTNAACLGSAANCAACPQTTFLTAPGGYTLTVQFAGTNNFTVRANRTIPSNGAVDTVTISANAAAPTVANPNALGFSIFAWLFQ
jgi:type IV pilus assembly protein PilE